MDWSTGFDRLARLLAGTAFFVILGVIAEDIWDDDDFAVMTSLDWAVIGGSAIGGGVVVFLVIRAIGWAVSGFMTDKDVSRIESARPSSEIAESKPNQ